ncbi:hypothetical protein QCA50_000651 [Cerrena zonata]|uniref:Nuclear pore complex protein n=1 Tax=Cerrena zonata TaxID=2478898 RepID=A0AAW0GTZ2_9APHY
MPLDSQHPDREKQVGVLFRDWLTEEQYQLAKQRQELGHQTSRRQTIEPETPTTGTPVKGKDLHYAAPTSALADAKAARVKAAIDLRASPGSAPSLRSRRISSISSSNSIPQSLTSPTIGNGKNEHSSWEKKHQENVAMSRLTRKYEMLSQPPNTPSITITPPPASGSGQPTTQTKTSFTFGPPSNTTNGASGSSNEPIKAPSVVFPSTNGTPSPSEAKASATGSTLSFGTKPPATAAAPAAAQPASTSSFSFGKPAAPAPAAASAPTTTSSSGSVPNFFGIKAPTPAAAPAPAPSAGFSILGAASNASPAAPTTSQPEPPKPVFSFGAPSSQPKPAAPPSQPEAPKPVLGFPPAGQSGATSLFGAPQQQKPAEQPSTSSGWFTPCANGRFQH